MDSKFDTFRLRPEIAQSWLRATTCGLTPTTVHHAHDHTVDADTPLARTAFPILNRLQDAIGDGRFAFMLTDRSARLIRTVHTDTTLAKAMADMGAEVGTVWSEERTGTNALATPFATRQPIFIHGEEHFVDAMKLFSCYGAPIFDPISGHVEGVLDVMMDATTESPLMVPVVDQAVRNIERELERGQTENTQELVAAFTRLAGRTIRPVIACGPDVMLNSPAAAGLLTAADFENLRDLLPSTREGSTVSLDLHSGSNAEVVVAHRSSAGAVFSVRTADRAPIPRAGTRLAAYETLENLRIQASDSRQSLIVVGEVGTGRTTVAYAAVGKRNVHELDGGSLSSDHMRWELLKHRDDRSDVVLLIENCEQLGDDVLSLVAEVARSSQVVATYVPTEASEKRVFPARFPLRIDLPPLRELRHDILGAVRAVKPRGSQYQFDSRATRAMSEYGWPGNLIELEATLMSLVAVASTRVIRFSDLPLHVRQETDRSLTPWQRASRDAIVRALEIHCDNKSHAAEFLGISRSSLYHHMRELGLS